MTLTAQSTDLDGARSLPRRAADIGRYYGPAIQPAMPRPLTIT
jgi:hypothetical protein